MRWIGVAWVLSLAAIVACGQTSPQKPMATDADPSFEVATIKPGSGDGKPKYFRIVGFLPYFLVSEAAAGVLTVALIVRVVRARMTEREMGEE